jgi:hypothetical protein
MNAADRYLDLLAQVLTRYAWIDEELIDLEARNWKRPMIGAIQRILHRRDYRLVMVRDAQSTAIARQRRAIGDDWPQTAETMVGLTRLANVRELIERVLRDGTPGDFMEAGVWRGGATIYMRAVLACHDVRDRTVWVADSFQGLPASDPSHFPADAERDFSHYADLRVGIETVKKNFARYGLLDDQVRFVEGWFADTLPNAPVERLAVLRLDADLYESTWQILTALYDKVEVGGFVIVDDYGELPPCRKAVDDFRGREGITAPIEIIDQSGVYWQKR